MATTQQAVRVLREVSGAARLQRRAQPRRRRRRLALAAPAPARRAPVVGRRQLHHRARRHQDAAAAARRHPRAARRGLDVTLAEDAALAARLVREAGALAHRMRGDGLDAETKTSISDVVTAADHAAERLVVDDARRPSVPTTACWARRARAATGTSGPHLGDRPGRRHLQLRRRPRLVVLGDRADRRRRPASSARSTTRRTGRTFVGGPGPADDRRRRPARAARRPAAGRVLPDDVPPPAVLRRRGRRGLRPDGRRRGHAPDARLGRRWTRWRSPQGRLHVLLPALACRPGTSCPAPRSSGAPGGRPARSEAAGVDVVRRRGAHRGRRDRRAAPCRPERRIAQGEAYGHSAARPWKARMLGLTTRPSRISMAWLSVSSASHEADPSRTGRRKGMRALLLSQVAEFQRYDGLWSTA